jgi:hypothetical protein
MAAIVTLTMNPALDIAPSTDRVEPTNKQRSSISRYDPGDGGISVARAMHAMGADRVVIFPAGGAAGEMIRYLLEPQAQRNQITHFMTQPFIVKLFMGVLLTDPLRLPLTDHPNATTSTMFSYLSLARRFRHRHPA